MVPTKGAMTGTITNIIDWTTEVSNFNLDFQTVGYSPFITHTNLNAKIVWTLTVLSTICSSDHKSRSNIKAAVFLASICSLPAASAMPPNIQADYDIVPGMKVIWDGIPINDFLEEFMRPLDMGLGQIVQDGYSLLSCIRGSDAAGYDPLTANPHYAVANRQQRSQHDERNRRAFACIMNRIDPLCEPYYEMMSLFNNDGIGAYDYIAQVGNIPYTPDQLKRFESDWTNMNIYTLEREHMLTINVKALFVLCGIIRKWSRRLRKTKAQERAKFLEAVKVIPSMTNRVENEMQKPDVNWRFRANYPAFYPAGIRGTPHPFAGQPDIYRIAQGFHAFWLQKIHDGSIKKTPKGLVHAAIVDAQITPDNVFIVKSSNVTSKTQCFWCGGFGHPTVCILDDGTAVECASKALKINVDKSFLSRISYPDGVPNRINGPGDKKNMKKAHYTGGSTEDKDKDDKSDDSSSESSSDSSTSDHSKEEHNNNDMIAALKAFAMQTGMSADDMKKAFKRGGKKHHKHRSKH